MNKYVVLLLALAFTLVSCNKDDDSDEDQELVPLQVQFGLAINYTATWCGPCGQWGAPLIHDFADAGQVVAITAHAQGDPMYNSALYNGFASDRPTGGGIPSFWVGDINTTKVSDMNTLLNQVPVAGIALRYDTEGGAMTIDTKTEFFSTQTGIYYLVVLLLESGIDGSESAGDYAQNGTANPESYKHDYVLRASSSDNSVYGIKILTDPAKGDFSENTFTIQINESWNNEIYPVAILWKKNSLSEPVFEFINAVM